MAARKLPGAMREEVNSVFEQARHPAPYLLYRTCQADFHDSPHNLLPSQRKEKQRRGWTVYLDFWEVPPTWQSLYRIFAFPDTSEVDLPRQIVVRLSPSVERADIDKFPDEYVFSNLSELACYLHEES
jgi:hypothetical protein